MSGSCAAQRPLRGSVAGIEAIRPSGRCLTYFILDEDIFAADARGAELFAGADATNIDPRATELRAVLRPPLGRKADLSGDGILDEAFAERFLRFRREPRDYAFSRVRHDEPSLRPSLGGASPA